MGDRLKFSTGTYDVAGGETFPITVNAALLRDEPGSAGAVVIDNGFTQTHVLTFPEGVRATIENLVVRDSTASLLRTYNGTVLVARGCAFEQPNVNYNDGYDGVLSADAATDATFEDCSFTCASRHSVIRMINGANHRLTISGCVFTNNASLHSTILMNQCTAAQVSISDTIFRGNLSGDGTEHDAARATAINLSSGDGNNPIHLDIDRCTFADNEGAGVIGIGYPGDNTVRVRNSLFVDNVCYQGTFHGFANGHAINVENCTFIGGSGGFPNRSIVMRMANSIIAHVGRLSYSNCNGDGFPTGLTMVNTLVWDTGLGEGYNTVNSANVTFDVDPILENIEADFDDPAFDARPRPGSPAIDAGDNANVLGDYDLAGAPRIRVALHGAETATVDLGCYEADKVRGTIFLLR